MCQLHATINALCFWELPVGDDGLKGIVDFAVKSKPVSGCRHRGGRLPRDAAIVITGPESTPARTAKTRPLPVPSARRRRSHAVALWSDPSGAATRVVNAARAGARERARQREQPRAPRGCRAVFKFENARFSNLSITFPLLLIWLQILVAIDSESCQTLFPIFCALTSEVTVLSIRT